jgi:radical SAM superfamily enzyme YgiQ (UPF0313 family)
MSVAISHSLAGSHWKSHRVLLLSTYELGRQPFGLASPAAWLRSVGAQVTCQDLSRDKLDAKLVSEADLVAFYLPMHTATRIAAHVARQVRQLNRSATLCAYGLYAPANERYLRELGFTAILGGEFETGLVELVTTLQAQESRARRDVLNVSLARQRFLVPDRSGLPPLARYAEVIGADGVPRVAGYTEASRGCKHVCRHCPIVPVYQGKFRIVQRDVVLADIRNQVEAGAQHITFGDPDFFNGIKHATLVIEDLHRSFPTLTYDVTIKVEHLIRHADRLPLLRQTGCAFVTSAVESIDNRILALLDKGHTYEDFLRVVELFHEHELVLSPTFVAFNPWITLDGYAGLLQTLHAVDLVDNIAPIQYAIRLLIPAGSRLLELPDVQMLIGSFDSQSLAYPWAHADARTDALQLDLQAAIKRLTAQNSDRRTVFNEVAVRVNQVIGDDRIPMLPIRVSRAAVPYLTEPWYC